MLKLRVTHRNAKEMQWFIAYLEPLKLLSISKSYPKTKRAYGRDDITYSTYIELELPPQPQDRV